MCRLFSTPPGMWSSDFLSLRPVNFTCRADDVLCLVTQSCPTLCDPRLLCSWGFSRQEYWRGLPFPPPGDLPIPGIKPRSFALQADSLPSVPPEKSKNTGVGSLSLLQGILDPNPGIGPGSLALQADSLPSVPPKKSKDTGVGSLSLLQRILYPNPGIKPGSPALKVDSFPAELPGKPTEQVILVYKTPHWQY